MFASSMSPRFENLERVEQLAAEERRAARIPGERGERRHDRPDAGEAAEVRLDAPDRHDDLRRHGVVLARCVSGASRVMRRHLPCVADDRCARLPGDVGFERQHDFRLRAIALENDRQRLVDRVQRLVDDFLPHPARDGFGCAAPPASRRRTAASVPAVARVVRGLEYSSCATVTPTNASVTKTARTSSVYNRSSARTAPRGIVCIALRERGRAVLCTPAYSI